MSDRRHRLTEAQEGLWFAQQIDPDNPLFNTAHCINLHGLVDIPAFIKAVDSTLEESEAFRLGFVEEDGSLWQVSDARPSPRLAIHDLRQRDDAESFARHLMKAEMETPRDPLRDPLVSTTFYRITDQFCLWHLLVHHLLSDAYAMDLVTRRVAELYNESIEKFRPGERFDFYRPVMEEDHTYRTSDRRIRDRDFWLSRKAAAESDEATIEFVRSAHSCHRHHVALDGDLVLAIQQHALSHDLSWPDALTALTAAYFQRFDPSEHVSIGMPFMARMGSATARVPCLAMNVVPLTLPCPQDVPIETFMKEAAEQMRLVRRHGRYRSEAILRDWGFLSSRRKLFSLLINVIPFGTSPRFAGLDATIEVQSTGPVDDLTVMFRASGPEGGLSLEFEANPLRYQPDDVAGHAARLRVFLRRALDASTLADVPTVTDAEAAWLRDSVNDTAHPVADKSLVALIEDSFRAHGDRTALVFEGEVLRYDALDRRSRALASQLVERGIGRDSIVAVALVRSLELVIALVAILRAGGAYLPLDPDHPEDRQARILRQSSAHLLLADESTTKKFNDVSVLPPGDWRRDTPEELSTSVSRDDPAYVIFTSGSTGEPKGVVVGHRAIVNRLEWMRAKYDVSASDRFLQKTPTTFDVSVWEFFLPLISGATLVIAPPGAHRDPAAISGLIRRHAISAVHFVPSMLDAFLADGAGRGLQIDRTFCSGEELTADLRNRFHRDISGQLHNLYGPTEAAVDVSYWDAGAHDESRPVPIGFPVWNTQLHILDQAGRLVPAGVVGHLYIGGVQLADGYLGRDDLTRERFIENPLAEGERIYKTGDLALRRADGAIVYFGRSDQQVKLRGLRIELGEIDSALASFPGIRQAATSLREDNPGDKRLAAYIVADVPVDTGALRQHLTARLPDYMVPASIDRIDTLPVSGSGKLDRARLPRPAILSGAGRLPRGETEERLARLFAQVLGVERPLHADDDFFTLGGNSLLAVRLLRSIRDEWGKDPGFGAIFATPTLERLAAAIDNEREESAGFQPLLPLSTQGDGPLFAIHPAGGLGWCYRKLALQLAPHHAVCAVQALTLDPAQEEAPDLDALAARYIELMRSVRPHGPYRLLGWSVGGIIAHAMAVQLEAIGETVDLLAMLDSYPSDCWRDRPEPSAQDALTAVLAIAGFAPEEVRKGELTQDVVMSYLRGRRHPLAQLTDAQLAGIVRTVAVNNSLVRRHRHGRFNGTITHFRAALDHASGAFTPDLWQPYAQAIRRIDVPSVHAHLTGEAASAIVASALLTRFDDAGVKEEKPCGQAV